MEKNKNKIARKVLAAAGVVLLGLVLFFANIPLTQAGYGWDDLGKDIAGPGKDRVGKFFSEDIPGGIRDIFTGGGGGKEVTSFVEFEGGLQPPSGEGLAPELTRVKTAREFILNITNFALSFLGLIAVIVIIYGGFLYVTARGEEEQTGTGKKAIQYAVIGIIIILFSFAAVNTLITQGPTGGDDRGSAEGGRGGIASTNVDQGRMFNLAALEVQASIGNFLRLYQNFTMTDRILRGLKDFSTPRSVSEVRTFLSGVESAMNAVKNYSSPQLESYVAANNVIDSFVRKWGRLSNDDFESLFVDAMIKDAAAGVNDAVDAVRNIFFVPSVRAFSEDTLEGFYQGGSGPFHDAFKAAMDAQFYLKNPQPHQNDFKIEVAKIKDRLEKVKQGLGIIGDAPAGRLAEQSLVSEIQKGITSQQELQRALAGIPPDLTVKQAFDEILGELETKTDAITDNPDDVATARDVIEKLGRLYLVVKEIKFMAIKINASAVEGNAPFGVKFTSLGSIDPSGETITDGQHEWDLDGNGRGGEDLNSAGCSEKGGASIACVYDRPGTYRISLRMNPSPGVTQTGAGIATITVKVNPPSSRIHLVAQQGDTTEVLSEYASDGKLKIAKNTYTLTLDEAKTGVKFDASKTTDGGGIPGNITNFQWNFGDGSDPIFGQNATVIDNPKKTYNRTGVFPLTLEVMDKGGKKDRKIVNVTVTSVAARILAPTLRGDLNTTFVFDGSHSKSDLGSIDTFEWSILDQEGREIEGLQNNTSDKFRYAFQNPGRYTVRLQVTDKAGNQAQNEVSVAVESQKPTADFEIRGCVIPDTPCIDPSQPSLVEFDASKSFDPDSGDILSYRWHFPTATALNDYEIKEGKIEGTQEEVKKIRVKFKKVGTYKITLTVQDQHRDIELRKEDSKEKEFQIASAVDLAWDPQMKVASKLDEKGVAVIAFKANTANADQYSIDFGDGSLQQEDQVAGNQIVVSHAYEQPQSYEVTLKAKSGKSGETVIKKRVYVAPGDSPLAVIDIKRNGQSVFFEEENPYIILRKQDTLTFDANGSINTRGKSEGLEYSWNFGDGLTSPNKTATHTYENVSPADPGYYRAVLTVIEEDPATREPKTSESEVKIAVLGAKPTLSALSVVKRSEGDETPLNYDVRVEGAEDADGQVVEYTFWYFDEADPERKLSVVTTNQNSASIKVETRGEAGEEKRYSFCVEMKDNENNISTCEDLFPDSKKLPFAMVKNGPNEAPTINITPDRSNIKMGESVTLSARAEDKDGRVAKYVWDILGDGFHNDSETELSQITQKYEQKSPLSGYRIRAKAIDDRGAEGFSNEIILHVDPLSNPPIPRFTPVPVAGTTIRFNNYSVASPGSGATLEQFIWDFDTQHEFCTANERQENVCPRCTDDDPLCDRIPDNDPDSTVKDPEYEFPSSGRYEVRLKVIDSNNQNAEAVNTVTVERGNAPQEAPVKAILRVETINGVPARKGADGRYHLSGNGATVTFYMGDSRGQIFDYNIDQNIYFDSDGDGGTENDRNFISSDGSRRYGARYTRNFEPQPPNGLFIAQLTIKARNDQNQIITDVTALSDDPEGKPAVFVFDRHTGAAALFDQLGAREAILLGLVGGVILAVMGYFLSLIMRRGKPREI